MKKILSIFMLLVAFTTGAWAQVTAYSNDYEGATPNVDWTSGNTGRYTVAIEGTTDHYLHVADVSGGNNGTTITCSATNGKVAAGTDFYMSFDLVLDGCNSNGRSSFFYIYDKNNSSNTPILKIKQNNGGNYKDWTINDNTALATGGKGTSNWYNYVLTRIGTKEYLTVTKKSNSTKVLDMVELTNLSTDGGLGKMTFETNRYYAGLYVDNMVLRALNAPAFILSTTEVTPTVGGSATVDVTGVNGTVSVSSNNTSAATATYADGKIMINGIANGVADITVTAVNDGAKLTQTITATVGAVATTTVTVNYKSGDTSIASPVIFEDVVIGSTLTASDITYDDVVYGTGVRYVNPIPDQTIPYVVVENGVVNINYTSQAAVTNVKKIVKAGDVTVSSTDVAQEGKYVGDVINFSFPCYINYEGTLYSKDAINKTYSQSFTLTATDQECTLAYTETNITNVVYHSEGENISGATATSAGGNMGIRSSNQQCGYAESDLTLINLPAGLYKVSTVIYSNSSAGATMHFQYGDTPYDEVVSGANNWSTQTEEITILSASDFKWLISGGTKDGLDFIYIQKTAEIATIPSSGIGTIASAYAIDCANLPSGVKAYKVSNVSANAATLEEVTTAVAPGTGLILRGTAGTYDIPVVAEGTDISGTNELKAAVTATDIEANTAYILQGGQFHLVNAASTVPAGKAYLPVANVSGARTISLSFGEITGVSEVAAEVKAVADGKFIKNGQLVIEKNGKVFNANGAQVK